MGTQFKRRRSGVRVALVALAVFSLPFAVSALQHEPAPPVSDSTVDQPNVHVVGPLPAKLTDGEIQSRQKPETIPCGETLAAEATGPIRTQVIYRLGKMLDHPDDYLGKTITVDGEMHWQFTDKVFTIQDDRFWRDRDMLVISVSPMSESVIPLQGSFERGKQVRVTGVLRPYDRGKLECLFGPLGLESLEGHSYTKNPVLIIGYKQHPNL